MVIHHLKYSMRNVNQEKPNTCIIVGIKQKFKTMKRILFAALLAVVAVGGAYKANATTYYAFDSNTPVNCTSGALATCSDQIGSDTAYLNSKDQGPQNDPQDISDLTYVP